ncbi:Outer capsid protein mu-1, partial [Bienertia sinuspersici]
PSNLITQVLLENDNYVARARVLTLSLKSRCKFVFVNGTNTKPSDSKKLLDWNELHRLKPLHTCSCGKCTYDVVDKFHKECEREHLHQFYIGIDDELYAGVRTNILSQSSSIELDCAC